MAKELKTNNTSSNDEIDLGQLFNIIGNGFRNLFNFFGNIFNGIFHLTHFIPSFSKATFYKICYCRDRWSWDWYLFGFY